MKIDIEKLVKEDDERLKGNLGFEKYCERAKNLYIMLNELNCREESQVFYEDLTPIEQIFYISYLHYIENEIFDNHQFATLVGVEYNFNFSDFFLKSLKPHYEIHYQDKKYIVDFVIDFKNNIRNKELEHFKYAIELDGYDYHNTKTQMNYDYKRERDLQKLGYKIIRFTGSQIYNEPLSCIYNMLEIIFNDIIEQLKKRG